MSQIGGPGNDNGDRISGDLTIVDGYIDFDEISTPSNPASNDGRLYVADDTGTTTLFFRDSSGTETNLLSGGGGDVTKVGTPVYNEIGVWTGDWTIE